jgi:phosphoglycerol transferase MdoB-like AlkP superfamily enzyme
MLLALLLAMGVGLVTRLALLAKSAQEASWNYSLIGSFFWGALYDLGGAAWWALPLILLLAVLPRRCFVHRWARSLAHVSIFLLLCFLLFGAVAEWVFWDEFGVRFNFIAVDYLVYTTEVIGNIRESYPMPLILGGIAVAAAGVYLLLRRLGWVTRWLDHADEPAGARWRATALLAIACLAYGLVLSEGLLPNFANNYNRELGKSGLWSLFAAFRANQLDYERFYPTMPTEAAFKRIRGEVVKDGSHFLSDDPRDLLRFVENPGPEQHLNVIQITVESLSASFLARYGNTQGITPYLDALIPRALVFDQFYATGNRTDRGMEALTLAVPPTPGRSLVKRPQNENLFTLGSLFRSRGYETSFIYGGFGYFDNMNYFFGRNGYVVMDRNSVSKNDVTFANVWGACDEDLFRWALRSADESYKQGKPFFQFVMTTSNHRPYTFPEGRIDLPSKVSGRAGAVKYTDYAIGKLLRDAESKPWFKNTVFIIVADHCASSAGKAELPVQNYHIPLLIYAPGGQIKPGVVNTLTSQVDFAPTLLGLLGWSYPSRFYGWNVLALPAEESGRVLFGNYQKLGYLEHGRLGVLKPVRQSLTFEYDSQTQVTLPAATDPALVDAAIANYQTASWLFKHQRQRELTTEEFVRYEKRKH